MMQPTHWTPSRHSASNTAYVQADISDGHDRVHLVSEVKEQFGRLDVLVNNAGVAPKEREDILVASEESFDRLMRINLKGPYFLDSGRRQLDDCAETSEPRCASQDNQYFVNKCFHRLAFARRVLYYKSRSVDDDSPLCGAAGAIRHRRF